MHIRVIVIIFQKTQQIMKHSMLALLSVTVICLFGQWAAAVGEVETGSNATSRQKIKKAYSPTENSTQVLQNLANYPSEIQTIIKDMIEFHGKLTTIADSKVKKSTYGPRVDIQKNYNHFLGYLGVSMKFQPQTICEVGFSAGHFATSFLFGSPTASYLGFEPIKPTSYFNQGNQSFSLPCFQLIESQFHPKNGKHRLILGNVNQSINNFVANLKSKADTFKCDLIHIDGEHFGEAPMDDMLAMASLAKEDGSTVVVAESSICEERHNHSVCAMPQMAWKAMMKTNVTKSIECVQYSRNRGYCVGQYAGDALAHVEEARALIVKRMNAMKPMNLSTFLMMKTAGKEIRDHTRILSGVHGKASTPIRGSVSTIGAHLRRRLKHQEAN